MIDLYQGTIGLRENKEEIVKALTEYLIKTDEDLTYGIKEDKTKVMLIIGKNELESKIPTFYHPVIFEYRNERYIAMDMRLFVNPKLSDRSILGMIRDANNGKLAIYRLILTKLFLDNDLRFMMAINRSVYEMFNTIIGVIYKNTTLQPDILPLVNLGCNYHYVTMEMDRKITGHEFNQKLNDITKRNVELTYPGRINDLLKAIDEGDVPNPSKLLGDLVDVISFIGHNTKAEKVTSNILLTTLSRTFIALNTSDLAIALVESKPNMIAIFYNVLTNSINKKTIMYRSLDYRKRAIDPMNFISVLQRVINENIVDY
jgi:hypothetical protein